MKNNTRRNRLAGYLMGMAVMLAAGGAQAACTQADLTGTWYAMGVAGNIASGYLGETDRCKIRVSSTGAVIPGGSSCTYRIWSGAGTSSITSGALRINTACAITGNVRFCNVFGCDTMRIQFAQMERNKTAFALTGHSTANPNYVIFFESIKQ